MDTSQDAHRILDLADLVTPVCLRIAARHRIADRLRESSLSAEDVAEVTGSDSRVMRRVLDHLAALEILRADGDGRYALAPRGKPLLSEGAGGTLRALLDPTHLMGRMDMAVLGLEGKLAGETSAYAAIHGREFWADMEEVGAELDGFDDLRSADSPAEHDAELIVRSYDWSRIGSVLDVGGGTGAVLERIAHEHPHITGVVLDLDTCVKATGARMERVGLHKRISVVSGDFFASLPSGFDVYLLSTVLNDWPDTDAVRILRRCAEAAGATGRVLIAELHLRLPDAPGDVWATRNAVKLEASIQKPDRSVAAIRGLIHAAGLEVTWEARPTALRSVIEARPRGRSE
ncbi:methyltransferase [Nocardiopsis baichengensis]|uniref:methyltransferase n=1 Tax=Nocardiopsis baichengensis TaxID=280240 RepID=UPI000380836D|nr:methyltransferase [Nocardiopsis baichengensis]